MSYMSLPSTQSADVGARMKWAKKDPELYVLGALYAGIFGAAGFHLGES